MKNNLIDLILLLVIGIMLWIMGAFTIEHQRSYPYITEIEIEQKD